MLCYVKRLHAEYKVFAVLSQVGDVVHCRPVVAEQLLCTLYFRSFLGVLYRTLSLALSLLVNRTECCLFTLSVFHRSTKVFFFNADRVQPKKGRA